MVEYAGNRVRVGCDGALCRSDGSAKHGPGAIFVTWNTEAPQTLTMSAPILQIPLAALETLDQEAQAAEDEEMSETADQSLEDETKAEREDVEAGNARKHAWCVTQAR